MNLQRVVGSYQPENTKAHIMLEAWEHNEMNNSPSSWFLKRWIIPVLLFFFLKKVNRLWSLIWYDLNVFINVRGHHCPSLWYLHIIHVYKNALILKLGKISVFFSSPSSLPPHPPHKRGSYLLKVITDKSTSHL